MVTSRNDNTTYQLTKLDGTKVAVPVVEKQIKAFKKRHEAKLNLGTEDKVGEDEEPD